MPSTQFKVEGIFGDAISKDSISLEQITEPKNFSQKFCEFQFYYKDKFFETQKKQKLFINRVLFLPNIIFSE